MRDVLPDIEAWQAAGEKVALATVVETWGSAPRPAGGKMAMTAGGKITGSVSGGCVENAVIEAGQETLKTGRPRLLHFGVADDTAWTVGLACGGTIEVFVERLEGALFDPLREAIGRDLPATTATLVKGPEGLLGRKLLLLEDGRVLGSIGKEWDQGAATAARAGLAEGRSRRVPLLSGEIFVDIMLPAPRLVIVGGVHIAIPLVTLARALGFRTILVDPREAFANAKRFPHVDSIVPAWPDKALSEIGVDSQTAIAVLTHDPKLDDPALLAALRSPAFYVGALGSGRTQEKRKKRLLEAGLDEKALARLHGPIGLPLGGRSPEEIALAILSEIVATRNRATPA